MALKCLYIDTIRSAPVAERGASYVEFAIVLPVLLILMMGTVDFGRLVTQIPWTSTVNYETALVGAETNIEAGISSMEQVFDKGVDNHLFNGNAALKQRGQLAIGSGKTEYKSGDKTVVAMSDWIAASIFDYLPLDFGLTFVAPQLLTVQDLSAGDLDDFDNGNCVYDCAGVEYCGAGSDPGSEACAVSGLPTPAPAPMLPTPAPTPIGGIGGGEDPPPDRFDDYPADAGGGE